MSMIASPFRLIQLNEAEITHGHSFDIEDFNLLPPQAQKRMMADAEKRGISEKQFRAMLSSNSSSDTKFSLHGKDPLEGLYMHELEQYDKAQDLAILHSKDLVKAYNQMIDGHIQEAYDCAKKLVEAAGDYAGEKDTSKIPPEIVQDVTNVVQSYKGLQAVLMQFDTIIGIQKEYNLTDAEVKKYVADALFQPGDNPEEVKKIINARIAYNNAIVTIFQQMLKVNYAILGLSKDEAIMLSEKIGSDKHEEKAEGIKALKAVFMENESKFRTGNHWDLRSVGGGCIFMTDEDVGTISKDVQLDRMLQMTMTYDAIVIGHGGDLNKKAEAVIRRRYDDLKKKYDKIRADEEKQRDKIHEYEEEQRKILKRIMDKNESDAEKLLKLMDKSHKDRIAILDAYSKRLDQVHKLAIQALDDGNLELFHKYEDLHESIRNNRDRTCKQFYDRYDAISDKLNKLERWYNDGSEYDKVRDAMYEKIDQMKDELDKEIHKHTNEMNDELRKSDDDFVKEYNRIKRKYSSESTWIIQPVKTLKGGPFTDVNDLVRQLIKEGFKNIMLVSCNPGHHQLAKDIRDTPGVKIHHAENSLLSENTTSITDPFYEVDQILSECEQSLIETCKECGFWYGDEDFINESLAWGMDPSNHIEVLVEGVLASAWNKVKELVKKALGFLVSLFKRIIEFFKNIIARIKAFFKKIFDGGKIKKDFKKPVTSSSIMVESARVNEYSAKSWDQLQESVIKSCESIAKKIQEVEKKQTKNMQDLERFAEQKAKSVNESSNVQLDTLLGLIL